MRLSPTDTMPAAGGMVDAAPAAACGDQVAQVVDRLDALLALSPDDLDALGEASLRDRVEVARRLQGMATAAMASAVAALDRAGAIRADGASSTTAWVASTTGASRRAAARTSRLAADLDAMPATRGALAGGQISDEAADVIVRSVRDGRLGAPDQVEATLLPVARTETPERLRAVVARRTQQADGAALARDETRQHARRRASLTRREDGMWHLDGLLSGVVGEKARTLFDAYMAADPQGTDPTQRRRPDQRLADAFAAVVDVLLDHEPTPTSGGVARPHLSVVVDITTFDADLTDPDDPTRPVASDHPVWSTLAPGESAWGQQLSPQTVRSLCCDAGVSRVVMAGASQVLDVGRLTRDWSAPQRRAITVRDRCCRGPGCGRPIAWTHIHHLQWWRNGGPTDIDNGLSLCPSCHDLIHHLDWVAELDPVTAAVTWTSPTGREVVTHPRPPT